MAKTKAKAKPASKAAKAKSKAPAKKPTSKPAKAAKSAAKAKAKTAKPAAKKPVKVAATPGWMDAGKGYELGIREGKIVARKDGKQVASVPKPLKEGPIGERLAAAVDFLEDHARTCLNTVESWMLRSLPVPRGVLEAVLVDECWQTVLKDAFVVPVAADGTVDREAGGFFRAADGQRGIGVVDRGGETAWIDAQTVMVPHPILLDEIDDLRQMAVEIGASQGLAQLFRETFPRPTSADDPYAVDKYSGGEFAMMSQAIGLAKRLGYRVTGGNAVCRVLENGRFVEARYELGDGDPMYETTTGELRWVDDKQRPLAIADVPPIAFSEGMRMAELIYAKRKIEKEGDDAN